MMAETTASSLEQLVSLLNEACSKNPNLKDISTDVVEQIVQSLNNHWQDEDDRKASVKAMHNILDPIVEERYGGEKK
jgi:hypothetical protein